MHFFSHSYLEQTLPRRTDWQHLASAAAIVMHRIAKIFAADDGFQTNEQHITSVLTALDHQLDVQSAQIVYLFQPQNHPLDMLISNQSHEAPVPAVQIAVAMRQHDAEWGILTNGRLWRLYHRDSAHTLEHFYEVNLPALLASDDPTTFLYFYAFFRRTAFDDQPLGLSTLLRANADAIQRLSDLLKEQALLAVRHIAQGLLDDEMVRPDAATLNKVYEHSLLVVCRLLFMRYAATRSGSRFDDNHHPQRQDAFDLLTYIAGTTTEIDYRDIPERYLGTLYEELLGYQLESMPRDNGWTVRLTNNSRQRKANGSYYTPDAIVAEIVDQTVGPTLRNAVVDCADDAARVQAILAINICDPAMGSGHFLVEATDYIARFLVGMGITPENREPRTENRGRKINGETQAIDCINTPLPFALGPSPDSDLMVWKRRVVQACIYGVDLDPLAVELAKYALWLATRSHDQPLTFLDHRLRCGNALIGGWVADLEGSDPSMQTIRLETYHRRANLAIARHFGLPESANYTNNSIDKLAPLADTIAQERRFLHWELAFPEVFFDIKGQSRNERAGFDVIIGNPPYMTMLSQEERRYFSTWSQTRGRELDLFALFVEQGLRLTRRAGWCGMIIPNVWMVQAEGEALRRHLLAQTVLRIVDYGFTVFGDATVPTATFICRKQAPDHEHRAHMQTASGEDRSIRQSVLSGLPNAQFSPYLLETLPILEKIQAISDPLVHIARSHEGIHSGNSRDALFTRTSDSISAKKMLKGADIHRYALEWGGWYVRYDRSLIDTTTGAYAALREESLFIQPKIWTRQTSDRIIATYDEEGFYSDNTLHSTQLHAYSQISPYVITALLNSRLLSFVYQERTQERGRPLAQVKLVFLRQLPFRRIDFTTPEDQRTTLKEQITTLYVNEDHGTLLALAIAQLAAQPERSDVVHDILDYLARQMIALHHTRQHALATLLSDLNPDQIVGLDRLFTPPFAPKTDSRDYGKRQAEFAAKTATARAHLGDLAARRLTLRNDIGALNEAQWIWLVGQHLRRGNQPELLTLYRRHQPAIATLDRRIAATDKLIDQIVYALYGLGEEEIAVVENR